MKVQLLGLENRSERKKAERSAEIPDPFPKIGQHMLVCAPTGSGKSQLIANLIAPGGPYHMVFDKIYVFSPTWDYDIYKDSWEMPDEHIFREFSDERLQAIVDESKAAWDKGNPMFNLILLDDAMDIWQDSRLLNHLTTLIRHYGLTLWTTLQYIKTSMSKKARQQMTSVVVAAQTSEEDAKLLAEVSPVGRARFEGALEAVREQNRRDDTRFHTMHVNRSFAEPFFMDMDIPIRAADE